MTRKLVLVGLDSFDIELARAWSDEGRLPGMSRLFKEASWGLTQNPAGIEAGSVWPTFGYGLPPDVHGQYDAAQMFDSTRYRRRTLRIDERAAEPFWASASKAGRRVALIDYPYAFLEKELNGVQVADWLTHVRTGPVMPTTYPAGFGDRLTARYGINPFPMWSNCPADELTLDGADSIRTFRDQLIDRARRKLAFSLDLLAQERWDLFMTFFHEAHDAGHRCWHIHDARHEKHDPALATAVGNPLRDVYEAVDACVTRLLDAVAPDSVVLVYLSHGMGPDRAGTGFLDDILLALERAYCGDAPTTKVERAGAFYRALVPAGLRRLLSRTPAAKRVYAADHAEKQRNRRFLEQTPNHATGGVRVNLTGREANGGVAPGDEYMALCRRLRHDLLSIVNADTGEPIATSVVLTAEAYKGPLASRFPDLLVEWNKKSPILRVHSPVFGRLERRWPRVRTGDHVHKTGAYFAMGPGITPGFCERRAHTVDFAPSIAAILGLDGVAYAGSPLPALTTRAMRRSIA